MANSYRVFTDKHYAYFVTWTIVDWLPLFAEPAYRQIVLNSLNYLRTNKNTELNAFVVMSSHVHAILWPADGINLSDITRDFKRFTSKEISKQTKQQGSNHSIRIFENSRLANRLRKSPNIKSGRKAPTPKQSSQRSLPSKRSIIYI